MVLRSPIVCILAHVDHGKTSILDFIRGSAIAKKEAGGITQMIGAYYLPKASVVNVCGPLAATAEKSLSVPGLLFIDTPGHAAFTSMRERGGSIADIAILVIDIMQGIQPQTIESLQILKANKTPFIIALNKVDLVNGWKKQSTPSIEKSLEAQSEQVRNLVEEKLYTSIGKLSEMGYEAERYDRVENFTKQITLVPCSAKTGEGIAELLLYLSGLCQKFLSEDLLSQGGAAKGSIIEVKEEKGLGTTVDAIIYDGTISKNDLIAFATLEGPKVEKIRGLLRPPLPGEETSGSLKYVYVDEMHAAAGIKIYAPGLEGALAGSPLTVVPSKELEAEIEDEIRAQVSKILIDDASTAGVIVKTDTLGSAEALSRLLKNAKIPVRQIGIGPVAKIDAISAHGSSMQDKYVGAVLAFNVLVSPDAAEEAKKDGVPIFSSKVIYSLVENYEKWRDEQKRIDTSDIMASTPFPAKLLVLPNCFFRLCKPAIFGVEIKMGRIKPKTSIMNEKGEIFGQIKGIQLDGKAVEEAKAGDKVAISVDGCYCGKTFREGDMMYPFINRNQSKLLLEKCSAELSDDEKELLDKISKIVFSKMIE
ncbi:translation initiation factor IF-2 [Candidatus Micrarchaeota archaeon CG10_big_fil_rev_8_21_14_0_10_45_29]|nr:MAG: translation initiation factor IF-2 [Candidatus Micrarchaeota archaeon CG10_big_fil_rev_8_21_14_0_10_45_29]